MEQVRHKGIGEPCFSAGPVEALGRGLAGQSTGGHLAGAAAPNTLPPSAEKQQPCEVRSLRWVRYSTSSLVVQILVKSFDQILANEVLQKEGIQTGKCHHILPSTHQSC